MKPRLNASCCPSGTFLFFNMLSRLSTSKPLSRVRKPCSTTVNKEWLFRKNKINKLVSVNRFAAFLQIKATEPLSGKGDFVSHSGDTVYFVLFIYTIGADFLHISHTFIKDGVKLSDSTGRWKADCSLLVLLLKVLKPLVWTHT